MGILGYKYMCKFETPVISGLTHPKSTAFFIAAIKCQSVKDIRYGYINWCQMLDVGVVSVCVRARKDLCRPIARGKSRQKSCRSYSYTLRGKA